MCSELWAEVEDRRYRWTRIQEVAAELLTITAAELADVFDALVSLRGASAGSLTVWVRGREHSEGEGDDEDGAGRAGLASSSVVADHAFDAWQRAAGGVFYEPALPGDVSADSDKATHGEGAQDLAQPAFVLATVRARQAAVVFAALVVGLCYTR